jgi:hypothetical protein
VGRDDDLRLADGLALQKPHEEILQLWVQVRLGLLDEQDAQRGILVLGRRERGEQDGHVEQVVIAQAVLLHL